MIKKTLLIFLVACLVCPALAVPPPNRCFLVAVSAHRLLPQSSLILNIRIITGKGKVFGHSVLYIPLETGFGIYQEEGTLWFPGRLATYTGTVALYRIMLPLIEKGDYIALLSAQACY